MWPRRTRSKRIVTGFEMYPRLPVREILAVLVLVAVGVGALVVNAKKSHPELHGPIEARLKQSGGVYTLSLPFHTPMARAWHKVMRPFPSDAKLAATYAGAVPRLRDRCAEALSRSCRHRVPNDPEERGLLGLRREEREHGDRVAARQRAPAA